MIQGRMSEIYGRRALDLDKCSLSIGYKKTALRTWDVLNDDSKRLLQAYTDGVNDFLEGIGYWHEEITAFHLPPEFYAFNIKKVEPWHPTDSLAIMNLMKFQMTQNWNSELLRDVIENLEDGQLKDMVDELVPFSNDAALNVTSIMNEEEMKAEGLWS